MTRWIPLIIMVVEIARAVIAAFKEGAPPPST
jgi:hypothetical protein